MSRQLEMGEMGWNGMEWNGMEWNVMRVVAGGLEEDLSSDELNVERRQ